MEKMMQANKSLRDARAQAHEKELVSAPDTACYKLHTICSSVHTHVHRVHYQTTLSCSTASLFSAHEKELADLEKCAQERVALDAVAAARKALEAKRFIERQAIRQAMIERATAELLQRTTDTDNREVGALTNAIMYEVYDCQPCTGQQQKWLYTQQYVSTLDYNGFAVCSY
eukprot:13991-Heterococcus_DN1.PRE.1